MPIAAVPRYLGDNFDQASPGMHFGMYLKILTVPPRSHSVFHVGCDPARLAVVLALRDGRWRERLAEAFEHAFTWLGFGAKTAVGYGAMRDPMSKSPLRTRRPPGRRARARLRTAARLQWDKGRAELKATSRQREGTAPVKGADAARNLFSDATQFERLVKKGTLDQARVEVRREGNMIVLTKIL